MSLSHLSGISSVKEPETAEEKNERESGKNDHELILSKEFHALSM
jgi:hypothetical protein